jgi:hypothetical protein
LLWSGGLVVDMSRPLDWMSVVRPRQPEEEEEE